MATKTTINRVTAIPLRHVVQVTFNDTRMDQSSYKKPYSYFTDLDLQEGDICVVEVSREYKLVTVQQVQGISSSALAKASKWIVQKVDSAAYDAKMAQEVLIMEIRNKLRQRRDELTELMIYKQLAGSDPEINALMEQLAEMDQSAALMLKQEKTSTKRPKKLTK